MARTTKKGLSYFPLDVDFFEDDKIEMINAEFGLKGENIALRLLCLIYKNGYWYKMGEDESLLLAKRVGNGVTGAFVGEVVRGLVKRSFFDERVFNSFQILTSRGIQRRFLEAAERRKSIEIIPQIMLVEVDADINIQNVDILPLNDDIGTQRRVKESKGEESKVKERERKGKSPHLFKNSEIFDLKIFEEKLRGSPYENANVMYYHERALNWSEGNQKMKHDWLHTLKNWMAGDLKEGKFISKDFQPAKNGSRKTGKQPTGADVDTKSAFDAIDKHYAKHGGA